MRIFRYKREETLGAYNFGSHQIYVCYLTDTKGNKHKGISFHYPNSFAEVPLPLDPSQANKFISFLTEVANHNLPNKHTLKCGFKNYFTNLYFNFMPYDKNMINSKISTGNMLGVNIMKDKVKLSSILACLNTLQELYNA